MNDVNSVDSSSAAAWDEFRALLADHLAAMPQGRAIVLSCPDTDGGASACMQFYAWDADTVRCEVVADEFLPVHRRWTADGRAALLESGFAPPPQHSPSELSEPSEQEIPLNWYLDRHRRYADLLAFVAVRVLHELWGAQHPSFVLRDGDPGPMTEVPAAPVETAAFDLLRAVRTSGDDGRLDMVERTLHHLLGFVPDADEDGDYPFRLGQAWIYLCPTPGAPFVQILAPLAAGVADTARALAVVADANRRWPHVKVLLDEDRVVATIDITVVPFVPQHVVDMLAVMERFIGEAADDLVAELGARPYLDAFGDPTGGEDPASERTVARELVIPDALRAVAEAVWDRGPDVDLENVLDACGYDRARVVRFLDVARRCESLALDRMVGDADGRVSASAGLDARVWRVTAALLTSAHRRLAAGHGSGASGSQLDLFGTDLAGGTGDSLFD